MRNIRVSTTVVNDACDESREYRFAQSAESRSLSAVIYMYPEKTSSIWATHYGSDNTWTISIGNVMIYDIGQKDMTRLLEVIQKEMEENNVTSDDSA
mgnify:CR=1 FL=1